MLSKRIAVLAAALVVGGAAPACSQVLSRPPCTATAGQDHTTLQLDQAANATTIAAVGKRLGVPDHGVTIALATALQESKLRNLTGGDRDSVGLFQQRPSQGWGARADLLDPRFAATAFYAHLTKIDGWEQLAVTAAAQRVQRSGAPNAYARWEPSARILAQALTGEVPAGLTCTSGTPGSQPGLDAALAADVGPGALGTPLAPSRGWLVASWLVARARVYPISTVSFGGRRWSAASGRWDDDPTATSAVTVVGPTR